jgi:hypothetical protein
MQNIYTAAELKNILGSRETDFEKKTYLSSYARAGHSSEEWESSISEVVDSKDLSDDDKIQFCIDSGTDLLAHSYKTLRTNNLEAKFLEEALKQKMQAGHNATKKFISNLGLVIDESPDDKQKILEFILINNQLHFGMENQNLKEEFLKIFETLPNYNKEEFLKVFEVVSSYDKKYFEAIKAGNEIEEDPQIEKERAKVDKQLEDIRIQAIRNAKTLTDAQKLNVVMSSNISDKEKLDFCFAHAKNLSINGDVPPGEMTKIIDAIIDNNLFEKALQREDVHKSDLGAKLAAIQVVTNRMISKDKIKTNSAEIFGMVKDTGLYSELKEIAAELKVKNGKDVKKITENPRLGRFGGMFSSNKENLKTKKQVKSFVIKLKEEKNAFDRHKELDHFRR